MTKKNREFFCIAAAAVIACGLFTTKVGMAASGISGSTVLYMTPDGIQDLGDGGKTALFPGGVSPDGNLALIVSLDSINSVVSAAIWESGPLSFIPSLTGVDDLGAVSSNGDYIVGKDGGEAFIWKRASSAKAALGTLGGTGSYALGVSTDGGVVAGASQMSGDMTEHAFRWTASNSLMSDLGTLGGTGSWATDMSVNDGSVVIGYSNIAGNTETHAFRWTLSDNTMHDLGTLGGTYSAAGMVSADGTVVSGYSYTAGGQQRAFRWSTADNTMHDLGTLGGNYSNAEWMSSDGSVIAGSSSNLSGSTRVFRWSTDDNMMHDLGTLGGGGASVGFMSTDGNIIVGAAETASSDYHAFRWLKSVGSMEDLNTVASDAGINMSGLTLVYAIGASDDANTYSGIGTDNAGSNPYVFILKLDASGSGLITPPQLVASLVPSRVVAQQGAESVMQGLGYSMFTARHALSSFAPARVAENGMTGVSAGADYAAPSRRSAYATGTFGIGQNGDASNSALNGSAGMLFRVGDNWAIGGGVMAGGSTVKTQLGGHSALNSLGASMLASYEEGKTGWRVYGVGAVAYLYVDETRRYMNGSSVDTSAGTTNGMGYGGAVHAGKAFGLSSRTSVEPYLETEYSQVNMQGYTEQGGAFAASYSDHDMHRLVTRLGGALSHDMTDSFTMGLRAAWGHRLAGDGGAFVASSSGFTLPLTGNVGDRDWAEMGMSGRYKMSDASTLSAEVVGRSGKTEDSRLQATVGLNYAF